MCCIFGVCIPYSVLWPFVLLFIQQCWGYIAAALGFKKAEEVCGPSKLDTKTPEEQEKLLAEYHHEANNSPQMVVYLTKDLNFNSIISDSKCTFVRFTAAWCKPCKAVEPLLNELRKQHDQQANFLNVDVDDHDEIAACFGIMQIPQLLCFKDGIEVKRLAGRDDAAITAFVTDAICASENNTNTGSVKSGKDCAVASCCQ